MLIAGSNPVLSTNVLLVVQLEAAMESDTLNKPQAEPKKEPRVRVCGYCESWCYQGEYLHHDANCQRPDQHN